MKNFQNSKKTGFLKKIFIKLCRILGFEIIDQNTFEIVTIDKKINDEVTIYWEEQNTNKRNKLLNIINDSFLN